MNQIYIQVSIDFVVKSEDFVDKSVGKFLYLTFVNKISSKFNSADLAAI